MNAYVRNVCLYILVWVGMATAYPVIADPFGTNVGGFNGITIYSNGDPNNVSSANNSSSGVITGMKWQCVEFVRRYYLEVFKINLRPLYAGGNANTWYDHADDMHLAKYANGSASNPRIGDIMVSAGGPSGHIAIVSSVSDNQVCVVEQNFHNDSRDADGSHCMSMSGNASSGYSVSGFSSSYAIQGWLRPRCDVGKCAIKAYGSIGWFPPVSDCRQATQWFILGDFGDGKSPIGTSNSSVCDQVPPACFQ